jgi:hypothetical protein
MISSISENIWVHVVDLHTSRDVCMVDFGEFESKSILNLSKFQLAWQLLSRGLLNQPLSDEED